MISGGTSTRDTRGTTKEFILSQRDTQYAYAATTSAWDEMDEDDDKLVS